MSLATFQEKADPPSAAVRRTHYGPLAMRTTPSTYFDWQSVRCRVLGALLLIPALPVIGLLVMWVRLTSAGPGIFRQKRVGLNGRPFVMYKLRTMRVDAEAKSGPVWALADDPRVTPLGRILRRLHLDEFPQLINVLKGEMALIGPRPERPEFVQKLAREIPGYLDRLSVRPGITGLAQINLPPDTDLESVRRKLALDLEYVERGCLLLDLRIFAATLFRLLAFPNKAALALLGLTRSHAAESQRGLLTAPQEGKADLLSLGVLSPEN